MNVLHRVFEGIGLVFLLAASTYFGIRAQPVEMGLVIVTAAIALAFLNIDKIQKFKGAGFEAEMRAQVAAIVEAQAEPDPEETATSARVELKVDDESLRVMKGLASERYTWRYPGSLSQELGLPRNKVYSILDRLADQGLVVVSRGKYGGSIWALSSEGRAVVRRVL